MLHFVPLAGLRISNPSLSQGFIGVLWHPAAQPYPRFNSAHLRLRCSLQTVSGLQDPFRTMEEVLLPCPPPSRGLYIEVSGAKVWRIARLGYPIGTPKEVCPKWSSKWSSIDDVPLSDPLRRGLPEFSSAPLKKRFNWCPRSPKEEDSAEVKRLVSKVRLLAHSELSIIEVMAIAIKRCIQPL